MTATDKKMIKWAINLVNGINKVKNEALKDERSTARYWNGDDWGSISGIRDAQEWVDQQIAKYILKHAKQKNQNEN